jgi:LacI family transcriptional regulator
MSMRQVAQLAGVSTSTVSRVVNERPNVSPTTVLSVRQAMKRLNFEPVLRRSHDGHHAAYPQIGSIALIVFGDPNGQRAQTFDKLLRGVSAALSKRDQSLIFGVVRDPEQIPPRVLERRVDGVLLHGGQPMWDIKAKLGKLPVCWLMANPRKPDFGDQVMPDNTVIGELAAQYLLRHGHRRLAYLGSANGYWWLKIRSSSFVQAAADVGLDVDFLEADARHNAWTREGAHAAANELIDRLLALSPRPTGLFVAEDHLLPALDTVLWMRGLRMGKEKDFEVISCNNEQPHLSGLHDVPATIDIRAESIGMRGVEQLIWRLQHPEIGDRVRTMVEPCLVEPINGAKNGKAQGDLKDFTDQVG